MVVMQNVTNEFSREFSTEFLQDFDCLWGYIAPPEGGSGQRQCAAALPLVPSNLNIVQFPLFDELDPAKGILARLLARALREFC